MKAKFLITGFALVFLIFIMHSYSLMFKGYVWNTAKIKGVGVSIYSDPDCSIILSEINWTMVEPGGLLEPGESRHQIMYIKNTGNTPINLTLEVVDWQPEIASEYISIGWNYTGEKINPLAILPVDVTLTVSPSVQNVTDFAFVIVIIGSG